MPIILYNPFDKFLFDSKTCFLSGLPLSSIDEETHVFPLWLMKEFDLEDKPFKLLDESISTYKKLKLPCAASTIGPLESLENKISSAFLQGYESVKALDKLVLFQWIGKLLYGIVFNEIQIGIRQQLINGEAINFSQALAKKFTNLHYMLQSIIQPIEFENAMPFSINVFEVDNPDNTFSYRDEINTLVFSLRMKNFGITACLQDNGANDIYHEKILKAIAGNKLHAIQFEELCGLYFYSAYLFNRLPEYTILPTDQAIYIEPMSLKGMDARPIFDTFQVKTLGQVLENFWKPWGFSLFEIIKNPEKPMTFLTDDNGNFRSAETIALFKGPAN
ncbi:hypothetical protein [Olivibacter domesticus]|uniref:Uncharacterized protein n=1 Tax=Olivibacter domesticus TaxID=407022 RepID=A0A1H7TS19_OLID1|nr:hypothetical protein [Olivibacter domesticus]SEL87234.1 hypothetical protein SAMN05661044_03650 [Olivibacter domesticus]